MRRSRCASSRSWTGPLEPTNEAYATAKLAGIALCQAYRAAARLRLHRRHSRERLRARRRLRSAQTAHVDPRADGADARGEACTASRTSTIWGTRHAAPRVPLRRRPGRRLPVRHAARSRRRRRSTWPAARASRSPSWPSGRDVVGYRGRLVFDTRKPDGMPLKALDAAPLAALGWRPRTDFDDGAGRDVPLVLERRHRGWPMLDTRFYRSCTASAASRRRSRASIPTRQDQEPGPPLDRPGGGLGRRLRGAAAATTSSSAPIAATPCYLAKGGDLRGDDRRAVRQGHRLHQGQGRLDAPHRRRPPA